MADVSEIDSPAGPPVSSSHHATSVGVALRREYISLCLLVSVTALILLYGLGERFLWDVDEGMHASMAQNMVLSGDWVTPVFNGEAFFDKPALFNWLGAISFLLLGFTEFAARLPAVLSGLGCVVLTYLIGRRLIGPRVGLIAGLIMATSLEFIILSRMVQYDVPFTLFTTASLYFLCSAFADPERQKSNFLLFYAAAGLAVLTKGPLGLCIPLLAVGGYLLYLRRPAMIREMIRNMQIPLGATIFLALVLPWYILMERANPGYLQYFVINQHVANTLGAVGAALPRHPEPFFYYVPVLFAGLFPWSVMLPQALRRAPAGERGTGRDLRVFLLIWVVCILLLFSLATSKLSTYILPAFPAAAVLLAAYWHDFLSRPDRRTRCGILIGAAVAFVLMTALAAYTIIADPWIYWEHERGLSWEKVELLTVAVAIMTGVVLVALLLRRYAAAMVALAVIAPFVSWFTLFPAAAEAEAYNSSMQIGIEYDGLLPSGEKMFFSPRMHDAALFYTRREAIVLESEDALEDFLASDRRVYALLSLTSRTDSERFDGDYYVIARRGNKAIVSNRPPGMRDSGAVAPGAARP